MYGRNGSHQVVYTTMSTAVTVSTYVQVLGAESVAVEFDTFSVGFDGANNSIYLQVSNTATTSTFKRLQVMGVYSAGSGILDWNVPDNVGNRVFQMPKEVGAYKYARIDTQIATTNAVSVDWHIST